MQGDSVLEHRRCLLNVFTQLQEFFEFGQY